MGSFCALFLLVVIPLYGNPPAHHEQIELISQNSLENDGTMEVVEQAKLVNELSPKTAPVNPEEPKPFKLMPHKAIYEIHIHPHKKPKDPTVSNVTGEGSIEVIKTKEGWVYKQNLEVQIHYHDGTTTTIERNIASWESPTEVSFHIENFRDGVTEFLLQGGAEVTEEGGWRVYFQKPDMNGFITNQHLIFPLGYLEKVLETIEKGKCILSDQIVFDAVYETQAPVRINTAITPFKEDASKDISLLPSNKLWRLQEALYDIQSTNPIPDYEEINIDIFSTGVIYGMETTWGEGVTVVLKLKELTVYQ